MINNWNIDFVGVLATEEDVQKRNVIVNSQNVLQFYVKLISDKPDSFPNALYFTCYASELRRYGFEDDYYRPDDERIEKLERFLYDYLLVFTPQKRVLPNHNEIFVCKNVRLVRKSDSYVDGTTFIPVPVFSEEEHELYLEELVDRLQSRKYIGRIEGISTEENDTPPFILWREKERYRILGEFESHQYAHGGYCLHLSGPLKVEEFQEEWLEDCYSTPENPTLMFIPLDVFQKVREVLEQSTAEVEEGTGLPAEEGVSLAQQEAAPTVIQPQVQEEKPAAPEPAAVPAEDSGEQEFLEHFIRVTREMGLCYAEKDLYNFHTAMKTSALNIIAGMSGTGKSRLVQAYARALGLDDDQFVMIPVRPSWTDDSDLIGYVDAMNMVYRPGDSGLINTLIQAQKEENRRSKLYLICFDEMNLARVEHYFSQFLSVLEMEPQRRFLRLYNDDLTGRLYNTAQYEPVIPIPENVLFVGTVNIDESTYHFSDKVLDRANVITLEVLPFTELRQVGQKERKPLRDVWGRKAPYSYEEYAKFRKSGAFSLTERETQFFWDIHLRLQEASKNLGVGPRVVRQIDLYIQNLPANPYISRSQALDLQVVQRILTKLRGPEGLIGELVGKLEPHGELVGSTLLPILDEYQDISDFANSRKVLLQKAKELRINGYTI